MERKDSRDPPPRTHASKYKASPRVLQSSSSPRPEDANPQSPAFSDSPASSPTDSPPAEAQDLSVPEKAKLPENVKIVPASPRSVSYEAARDDVVPPRSASDQKVADLKIHNLPAPQAYYVGEQGETKEWNPTASGRWLIGEEPDPEIASKLLVSPVPHHRIADESDQEGKESDLEEGRESDLEEPEPDQADDDDGMENIADTKRDLQIRTDDVEVSRT